MSDYDDYERREEFNREMDRQHENFEEDLKIEHERSEETSRMAETLIRGGNARAAAALYGYDIGAEAPQAGDDTPAEPTADPPPATLIEARSRLMTAIMVAGGKRQAVIDAVNVRYDWDSGYRAALIELLKGTNPWSEDDYKRLGSFMDKLGDDNADVWLVLNPFYSAMLDVDSARGWVELRS
jgi:hypothetical protein